MKKAFFGMSFVALVACGGRDGAAIDQIASSTPCAHQGPCDPASQPVCRPPSGAALQCRSECGLFLYQGELCPEGKAGASGAAGSSGEAGSTGVSGKAGDAGSSGASAGAAGFGGSGSSGAAGGSGSGGASAGSSGSAGGAGIGGVAGAGGSAGAGGASGSAGQAGSGGSSGPLLLRSFVGPGAGEVFMGDDSRAVFRLELKTGPVPLEVRSLPFRIERTGPPPCRLVGSKNGPHFSVLRWRKVQDGATVIGPYELPADAVAEATFSASSESLILPAGEAQSFDLVFDIALLQGGPGELAGCGYRIVSLPFGPGDVRVIETGEFVPAEKIVTNTPIEGNAFTVTSVAFINLGGGVSSSAVFKGTKKHPVLGLVVVAPPDRDIKVSTIPLRAWTVVAGSSCESFAKPSAVFACQSHTASHVERFRLMDGNDELAAAVVPETSGVPPFEKMAFVVPKDTIKFPRVEADLAHVASDAEPHDRLAVGVGDPSAFVVTDMDGKTVPVVVIQDLASQLGVKEEPQVVTKIFASGVSTVTAPTAYEPTIVVPKPEPVFATGYLHKAEFEATVTDRVRIAQVSPDGDCADVAFVGILSEGMLLGSSTLPSGVTCEQDIELTTPLLTPKDGQASIDIVVAFNAPVSGAAVDGIWHGVPRSGHRNRFAIVHGSTGGEWGSTYANALNVRTVGQASGKPLYSAKPVAAGRDMVLRAAQPVLAKLPLPSTVLSNGKMPFLRFRLEADGGMAAWKQIPLRFKKSAGYALGQLSFTYFGNPTAGMLTVIDAATGSQWGESGGVPPSVTDGYIVLHGDQGGEMGMAPGIQYVIEISGIPSGVKPGDVLSIELAVQKDPPFDVVTGHLAANAAFPPFPASPNLFGIDIGPWGSPSGKMAAWGWGLLWTDRSEVPHSSAIPGSSRDWTNGLYVPSAEAISQVLVNLMVPSSLAALARRPSPDGLFVYVFIDKKPFLCYKH